MLCIVVYDFELLSTDIVLQKGEYVFLRHAYRTIHGYTEFTLITQHGQIVHDSWRWTKLLDCYLAIVLWVASCYTLLSILSC